ncbi:MAG: serine hydrolase [Mongoliitalea sp.]
MKILRILLMLVLFLSFFSGKAQSDAYEYILSLPPTIKVTHTIHSQTHPYTSIVYQGAERVPAASLIKIPILVALLEATEAGQLDLDQIHVVQKEEIVGGAGELQFGKVNQTLTLEELAREMIRTSDNTATNIIISYLGMPAINSRIQSWGLKGTSVNRLMMDFEAIAAGSQNYTTSQNLVGLLEKVWKGELLNEYSRALFLELLKNCEDKSLIAEALPHYATYNKTGTLDYIRGDAAIIQSEDRIFIKAITVEGFDTIEQAEIIIRNVAKLLEKQMREKVSKIIEQ